MKTFRTFGRKNEKPIQNNHAQYSNQIGTDADKYYDQEEVNQQEFYDQNGNILSPNNSNQNYRTLEHFDNNNNRNDYIQDSNEGRYNVNNPTMYTDMQINPQNNEDSDKDDEEVIQKRVKINEELDYKIDEENLQNIPVKERIKHDFHFSTKIRNSGYWGKVKLRNGTWLVIIGFILFIISIVLIGVFWGFWYSNRLNYPMRTLAITFLSSGCALIVFGLISNYFMFLDRENKHILGSPLRASFKVLGVCLFLLVVASDCITVYYTYWENRWVNTPLIIVAIVLYFFAGIGFLVSLYNIFEFNMIRYGMMDTIEEKKEKKEKQRELERQLKYRSTEDMIKGYKKKSMELLYAEQQLGLVYNESELDESNNSGRNFRKNHPVKLTPKPVIITSNPTSANTSQLED